MKTRVWTECNPTPIPSVAPCVPVKQDLKYESMFMVHDGDLNRSRWWMNDDWTFKPREQVTGGDENLASPPDPFALQAVAQLALNADQYHPGIVRNRPIILDLEGDKNHPFWQAQPADTAGSFNQYRAMAQTIRTLKDAANWQCLVGAYGWPFQVRNVTGDAAIEELAAVLDFVAPCFYTVPPWNPDCNWFNDVERMTAYLDHFFGHLPKVAVMCPCYQVWWIDKYPQYAALNNKPVPDKFWADQLRFVVERDYQPLIFTGELPADAATVRLLKMAAGYLN